MYERSGITSITNAHTIDALSATEKENGKTQNEKRKDERQGKRVVQHAYDDDYILPTTNKYSVIDIIMRLHLYSSSYGFTITTF